MRKQTEQANTLAGLALPPVDADAERLTDFLRHVPVRLNRIGPDGQIFWASTADHDALGYNAADYIGRHISEFHADPSACAELLERLRRGDTIIDHSGQLRCKDGSIQRVRICSNATFDGDGRLTGAHCYTREEVDRLDAERIRILAETSELLASSLDFSATLASLTRLCVPQLADWCTVEILDHSGVPQQLAVAHTEPDKEHLARRLRQQYPPEPSATHGLMQVLRTGEPEFASNISEALIKISARDAHHEKLLLSLGLQSYLVVPIAVPGRILGALTLVSTNPLRRYGPEDAELALELARRAAQAIEHARIYAEATQARRDAEQAAARLDLLVRLSEAIAPSLDPDAALSKLAEFVVATLADYCVVYRLDEDGLIHRVALAHADPNQTKLVESLTLAGPPCLDDPHGAGAVLRTGNPILAVEIPPEMLDYSAQNQIHLDVLRQLAPRSSLIVPLNARDRTLGAVAFATTDYSGRRYNDEDVIFAQELSRRAALLIDNARLYRQAQSATQARDEMLAVVSHDLRSPLNAIVTGCELLECGVGNEQRARTQASIRRAASQMNQLLACLLDVTRIDEGRLVLRHESCDLRQLLMDTLSLYEPVAEHRGIKLACEISDAPMYIDCDRGRLAQAISNLLDNALKFTPEHGQVSITAAIKQDTIHISVADDGPGIPSDELPHLFDRFWRPMQAGQRGVGLGLTIVKGIVEAHGGHIEVSSEAGNGSQFTLVLPVTPTST